MERLNALLRAIADCDERQALAIRRGDWHEAYRLTDRMDHLQGQVREALVPAVDPEWRTEAAEAAGRG